MALLPFLKEILQKHVDWEISSARQIHILEPLLEELAYLHHDQTTLRHKLVKLGQAFSSVNLLHAAQIFVN